MASATTTPTTASTSTVTTALYQQALAQAKAALAAQQQPIQDEIKQNDATAAQRTTDAQGNALALSKILSGISPQVSRDYSDADQRQQVLAKGFSDGMQAALQKSGAADNATLAQIGAPAGQQIDPAKATAASDALYGQGGFIPASSFNREGAAFTAAADNLPAIALLKGQENGAAVSMSAQAQDVALQNKLAELAGNLPGDTQTNYMNLQTAARENAQFREQVKNDTFNQNQAIAKYKTGIDEFNANHKLAVAKMNQAAQQFAVRQQNANRDYQIALGHLGIAKKELQLKIAAAAFTQAHGGYSASQLRGFNQKLDALVSGGPTKAGVQQVPVTLHKQTGNGDGTFNTTTAATAAPTPEYLDANGKWQPIIPGVTVVPNKAAKRNTNTYANFVTAALKKGVPIQLALQRADSIWPETQRDIPDSLKSLPAVAAEAAQQANDYSQMTGSPKANGKVTLATGPNGQTVSLQMPKNVTPAIRSIVNTAVEYLGTPYAWGGGNTSGPTKGIAQGANTVGFDCSSFAQFLYAKVGVPIPRDTYDQFRAGTPVPKSQLQAGDLVFFKGSDSKGGLPGHVGIYIGKGQMIDAPKTGDVVRVQSISRSDYQGARRFSQ